MEPGGLHTTLDIADQYDLYYIKQFRIWKSKGGRFFRYATFVQSSQAWLEKSEFMQCQFSFKYLSYQQAGQSLPKSTSPTTLK